MPKKGFSPFAKKSLDTLQGSIPQSDHTAKTTCGVVLTTEYLPWFQTNSKNSGYECYFGIDKATQGGASQFILQP